MTTEEARELGALYALGVLDPKSERRFLDELSDLPADVREEIAQLQQTASLIAIANDLPEVPAGLRGQVLDRISSITLTEGKADPASLPAPAVKVAVPDSAGRSVKPATVIPLRRERSGIPSAVSYLLMAASLVLAIVSVVLYRRTGDLGAEVASLTQRLDIQSRQLLAERQKVDQVVAHATRMVALDGDAAAPQASARLFWDQSRQEWVIYFFDLPAAPSDKDYQLWYITSDQRKVSAQVFRHETNGRVELRLALPPDIVPALAATAVTLEPRGGSPQPTGQLVLKGAI